MARNMWLRTSNNFRNTLVGDSKNQKAFGFYQARIASTKIVAKVCGLLSSSKIGEPDPSFGSTFITPVHLHI